MWPHESLPASDNGFPQPRSPKDTDEFYWPLLFAAAVALCVVTFLIQHRAELSRVAAGALVTVLIIANMLH